MAASTTGYHNALSHVSVGSNTTASEISAATSLLFLAASSMPDRRTAMTEIPPFSASHHRNVSHGSRWLSRCRLRLRCPQSSTRAARLLMHRPRPICWFYYVSGPSLSQEPQGFSTSLWAFVKGKTTRCSCSVAISWSLCTTMCWQETLCRTTHSVSAPKSSRPRTPARLVIAVCTLIDPSCLVCTRAVY